MDAWIQSHLFGFTWIWAKSIVPFAFRQYNTGRWESWDSTLDVQIYVAIATKWDFQHQDQNKKHKKQTRVQQVSEENCVRSKWKRNTKRNEKKKESKIQKCSVEKSSDAFAQDISSERARFQGVHCNCNHLWPWWQSLNIYCEIIVNPPKKKEAYFNASIRTNINRCSCRPLHLIWVHKLILLTNQPTERLARLSFNKTF